MSVKEQSRLTAMQLLFLKEIEKMPRCRAAVKEVIDFECGNVCKSTFSRLARNLIGSGYIERIVHSPTRQQFAITQKGREALLWFTSATT